MHAPHGDDRPAVGDADPDALLRMRLGIEDATFVAEGIALGLPLKWNERALPFDDLPPRVPVRRAPDDGVRVPANR